MKTPSTLTGRTLGGLALGATLVLTTAACGSSGQAAASPGGQEGQQGQQGAGRGSFGAPTGSGKVAAVSGKTAQVQSSAGQVAVSWTAATRFTQQAKASAADLKVGECVVAMPARPSAGSSTGPTSSSDSTKVAAATVRLVAATKGSCSMGGFGGPGGPGGRPSGAPSGAPSGRPGGAVQRGGFGAFGKVTAVSGDTFTVASARPSASGGSASTTSVMVTATSATTWTAEKAATSAAVKVGRCVVSRGRTGSTGAVAATTISVSDAVNGACTSGIFGGGRPGGQQGEGQG